MEHGRLVGLLTLVIVLGGCGTQERAKPVAADRLGEPGAQWHEIAAADRLRIVHLCRPTAAVVAGRADASAPTSYLSDRYRAVAELPDDALGRGIDRWFAHGAHGTQPLRAACAAVAGRLAHLARLASAPHAAFAAPVTVADGPLQVATAGPALVLRARVSPASARLTINHAADRAPTTTTWTVRRHGAGATVALRDIPAGTSYLRVDVTGPTGHWRRLVVLRRGAGATTGTTSGGSAPTVLRGTGTARLATLEVPAGAVARVRSPDGPLAITTSHTLVLSVAGTTRAPAAIAAGRYAGLTVSAPGPWTLAITPAR